jgi:D-alanyl-D-alanine carboxypeptidase
LVLESEPDKFWEPEDTIRWAKEKYPPIFVPGEGFHYSDINYLIAGLVIESATGQQLHEVYREHLFGPLEMEHTYMEFREEPRPSLPERTLSHVYFGDVDYTQHRSTSADWAGGGLVTTTEDMNCFMQAFVNDKIFVHRETREAMLNWIDWEGDETLDYGLGVMRIQGKTLEVWGHLGVGQVLMFYWPDGDVIITGTLNQQYANGGAILSQFLKAVRSYQENQ